MGSSWISAGRYYNIYTYEHTYKHNVHKNIHISKYSYNHFATIYRQNISHIKTYIRTYIHVAYVHTPIKSNDESLNIIESFDQFPHILIYITKNSKLGS